MGNKVQGFREGVGHGLTIWGLYDGKGRPLPLTNITVNSNIINSIAEVTLVQKYRNDTAEDLEVFYYFPISTAAAFSKLEARYEGKLVKGVIKEKEEAKKEYQAHKEKGHTVAYAEINEETSDIMKT